MTEHLSPGILSALADGELTGAQLNAAQEHLASCSACTSAALSQTLLKNATAKAGQRYALPAGFAERMQKLTKQQPRAEAKAEGRAARRPTWNAGWAVAAVLLLTFSSVLLVERKRNVDMDAVAEVRDLHVAALAAVSPEVISTDRHTVKPWFQGKLPFSFNLPEGLPEDVHLEGGNLVYLHGQPVAQLLYSVGKHRASVFLRQRNGALARMPSERFEGFQVEELQAGTLEITAVSDVEASRLVDLAARIQKVQ